MKRKSDATLRAVARRQVLGPAGDQHRFEQQLGRGAHRELGRRKGGRDPVGQVAERAHAPAGDHGDGARRGHRPGELDVEAVVTYGSRIQDLSSRIVVPFDAEGDNDRSTWRGAFAVKASGGHELRFRVRPKDRSPFRPAALGMHIQKWL